MNTIQLVNITESDIQAALDLHNVSNKVCYLTFAPHNETQFIVGIANNAYLVSQIIKMFDISDLSAINDWIAEKNANGYIVANVPTRQITNSAYFLATKYII